ncbi:MAG: LPXTG cell wall anchor domain-containing protein [Ruminococcus sp.]|nr:LPXTG cell wall anchor domain-containing protein [Ruminococcus sp.]
MYVQHLRTNKKKRKQLASIVTALSVFVSGSVFWQLREIGTAMMDTDYEIEGNLVADSLSNSIEFETQDVWEASLPPLTDNASENLARIAESQLGYTESSINFVHAEDGETHNGYTRYGAWYGNPYGDWNTMFTYFCMNYAGIKNDDIPYGSGCWAWSLELDKAGLITPVTRGSPVRGDILLIDSDLDGKADRSCIVKETLEESDVIVVIEGDIDGIVELKNYSINDKHLLGMVSLLHITTDLPILPEIPSDVAFTAESKSGIRVEAHADLGAFPQNTKMFVFDISQDEAIHAVADHFSSEVINDIEAVALDITFTSPDGKVLEPSENSQVSVSIILPEDHTLSCENLSLFHVFSDGDIKEVENADVSVDGAIFVAESFSTYVLVGSNWIPSEHLTLVNGSYVNNTSGNPYVVHVGDIIDVFMTGNNNITVTNNNSNGHNKLDSIDGGNQEPYTITYNGISYEGIHRQYRAVLNQPVQISNSVDTLYLNILDKYQQYFVWIDGSPCPANNLIHNNYPNSESNPYIVFVGQTFDVFLNNSYFSLPTNGTGDNRKLIPVETDSNAIVTYDNTTISGYKRSFQAAKTGDVQCQSDDNMQTFYIRVIDGNANLTQPDIYVKTEFEYKNINRVKEHLAGFNLQNIDGYVPNGPGQYKAQPTPRPYAITEGQEFEIYIEGEYEFTLKNYNVDFYAPSYNCNLTSSSEPKIQEIQCVDEHPTSVTALRFKGLKPGEVEIKLTSTDGTTKSMWVRVLPNNEIFDHADMEIADGGKYTVTSTSYENGIKKTVIKVYDAYVSYVNSAKLLDSTGNPLALNKKWTSEYEYEFSSDLGDYAPKGESGETQHEFTSAQGYGGHPKDYNINDVKRVVFDVNITLEPFKQCTITDGTEGIWENLLGGNETIQNVVWSFNDQGIIDAINKCPMTNGLDFTIRSDAALVNLQAIKVLDGNKPSENQFSFELLQQIGGSDVVIDTVKNDAEGNILFLNQKYDQPGEYKYKIHEVLPTTVSQNQDMIYAQDQEIIIDVSTIQIPNSSGGYINALKAEMRGEPPTLSNYTAYTLPSTGGTGDLPYIIFGSAMISGALLLLYRRRKKEVAQ